MTGKPGRAPDQPAANDPQYRDAMKRYETSDRVDIHRPVLAEYQARIAELEAELAALKAQVQQGRRLRQSADSALAQALRHPNSKLDNVAGYLFRLEQAIARQDGES